MTTDPLPCPFCGSIYVVIHVMDSPMAYYQNYQCRMCFADGPRARNRCDALNLWNIRPPLPTTPETTNDGKAKAD